MVPYVLLLLAGVATCAAFCPAETRLSISSLRSTERSSIVKLPSSFRNEVDVVVFGVGDLRTDDHAGLRAAVESCNQIIPMMYLNSAGLMRIPGAFSHTLDMADLLSSALQDLQNSLRATNLDLFITQQSDFLTKLAVGKDQVNVHVCDLDAVDEGFRYGAHAQLQELELPPNVKLKSWNCHLREKPWKALEDGLMTDSYPVFASCYTSDAAMKPMDSPALIEGNRLEPSHSRNKIPSGEQIADMMKSAIKDTDRLEDERNSGLYGTHFGGLPAASVGSVRVMEALNDYALECNESDEKWAQHPRFAAKECKRNPMSLEHASVAWMLRGKGDSHTPATNNMIAGESMTRFLSLPLMLGTVSPRRVWHSTKDQPFLYTSNLKNVVEGREWHKILAARNMKSSKVESGIEFEYWRWHGFLCRYAKKRRRRTLQPKTKDEGILLVHGFGASASQWERMMTELSDDRRVLAPDLIGFGEAEKPPLTYTQYLWNFFISDFIKDIAIGKKRWDSFFVSGNSIGGFTSMSVAADDAATAADLSSSGAPGTGQCRGLALINSAGQIYTREQVDATVEMAMKMQLSNGLDPTSTMAEVTASGSLPECSPLPRPIARLLGNGLLSYLRPQIGPICKRLYPTNPDNADGSLAQTILRDSLDLGAINVMISGSKLPPPRTANELLAADFGTRKESKESKFEGPVLVAQGFLDPLNDSPNRAQMLAALRKGITVTPINGGHCPHDELPGDVAKAIMEWIESKTECTSHLAPPVASARNWE